MVSLVIVDPSLTSPPQALELRTGDVGLLPYEIMQLVKREFATPHYTGACSQQFLDEVRDYIDDNIAKPAAKYRAAYNMPAALEPLRKGVNPLGTATRESSLSEVVGHVG